MGYDLNKFVSNDIPNHLICFICKLVLQDPLQAECEHYFCNQCITIYLTNQTHCPHYEDDSLSVKSDKKKSPLRKMSFRKIIGKSPKESKLPILKLSDLKNLPDNLIEELNSLKVNCDYNSNGCKEELILSKLKEHVRTCKFVDLKIEEENKTEEIKNLEENNKKESVNIEQMNKQESDQTVKVTSSDEQTRVDSIDESNTKRKDSENKSGEEEVGSDDFVVIPKTIKASSSSTKSTESVQTNSSTMISSKENVNKVENQENVEKKKKKKKKKKSANKQSDEDAVSLKGADSEPNSATSSKTQSKESLVESSEEVKRALKDAEIKSENLRLINSQLLGQIKKLKDEKEEFTKKLQSQLDTADEVEELKNKIQNLENENKSQALRIVKLLESNDQMNSFILTLRDEQSQIKEKYNSTLNEVQKTLNFVKNCKQSV